jgi:glycosyltransferase involved in cell wall biosynthesis
MSPARRILVLSFDPVDASMAGPAIRAWHLAEELAQHHDVILASTAGASRSHPQVDVRAVDGVALDELAAGMDGIVAPVSVSRRHPGLVASGVPLAVDLYIPTHLENLERGGRDRAAHALDVAHQVSVIDDDLAAGDFFLCASERQRDFWLGALASAGRVNPLTAGADPSLRSLIDVVPFGLPSEDPVSTGPGLRQRFGIPTDDAVLLWGGGVYEWLDPVTAVRAVGRLRDRTPAVHLVFLGLRNPNPGLPEMAVVRALRSETESLGLTGSRVHFNDSWVPYEERAGWLLDADLGISTHADHLETRFSFRTRVLDYLWARLPMVLTSGDELSEQVQVAGLGRAVAAGDDSAVAAAVEGLLAAPPPPSAWDEVIESYRWDAVVAPLVRWAEAPRPAADRDGVAANVRPVPPGPGSPAAAAGQGGGGDVRAALARLAEVADIDVDVPTQSRRPPGRVLKQSVKTLTAWYFRYLGQQTAALGDAIARLGTDLADRADDLADQQAALTARVTMLEDRVKSLESSDPSSA